MEAGKPFQIDGSASIDPDGDDLLYMWTLSGLGSPVDLSTKMSDLVVIDTPGNDLVIPRSSIAVARWFGESLETAHTLQSFPSYKKVLEEG